MLSCLPSSPSIRQHVDLANRQMEAYAEPSVTAEQADYRRVRTYQSQDVVPVMLGDRNDLLP